MGRGRAKAYGVAVEDLPAHYAKRNLMSQIIYPADIADGISKRVLKKSTGNMINVDGGMPQAFFVNSIQYHENQSEQINEINRSSAVLEQSHTQLTEQLNRKNIDIDTLLRKLGDFQVAIPSWAWSGWSVWEIQTGGEPSNLIEKLEDIGLLNSSRKVLIWFLSLPWDSVLDY